MPGFLDFFGSSQQEPAELALDQGDLERLQLQLLQAGDREGAARVAGVKMRQADRLGLGQQEQAPIEQQLIGQRARRDPSVFDFFRGVASGRERLNNALSQERR